VLKQGVPSILGFLNKIAYGKTMGSIELSNLSLEHLLLPWDDLRSKLQALVLSRNQLASLPVEIDRCTCLTSLWVRCLDVCVR
jgi:Leucine-rich repeat (LRR) protein